MTEQQTVGNETDLSELDQWLNSDHGHNPYNNGSTNFVEITRLPKKITPKALASMIVSSSRIVPKLTEICCKQESMERVALVEFKTVVDAYQAVDRLRTSQLGRKWHMKFIADPKFADPEKEMFERFAR